MRMKRWRKVEIAHTLLSAIILASLLGAVVYHAWPAVFRHSSPEAVKLLLIVPSPNTIIIGQPFAVKIYAANADDQTDRSRSDTVELMLDPPDCGAELNATRVTLLNGEATVTMLSTKSETVTLTANWVEGRTPLKSAVLSLSFVPH